METLRKPGQQPQRPQSACPAPYVCPQYPTEVASSPIQEKKFLGEWLHGHSLAWFPATLSLSPSATPVCYKFPTWGQCSLPRSQCLVNTRVLGRPLLFFTSFRTSTCMHICKHIYIYGGMYEGWPLPDFSPNVGTGVVMEIRCTLKECLNHTRR